MLKADIIEKMRNYNNERPVCLIVGLHHLTSNCLCLWRFMFLRKERYCWKLDWSV